MTVGSEVQGTVVVKRGVHFVARTIDGGSHIGGLERANLIRADGVEVFASVASGADKNHTLPIGR